MSLKIYLRLEGEHADIFTQIKRSIRIKNDTEVLRFLIGWYYNENVETLEPKLRYLTCNSEEVLVLDRDIDQVVHILFSEGIPSCSYCKTSECSHTVFALAHPETKKMLKSMTS